MSKRALLMIVLGGLFTTALIITGCGVKSGPETPAYPTVASLLDSAWVHYQAADYDSAFSLFTHAAEIDASEVLAHIGRGWCFFHLGKYKDAHASFDLAISLEGIRPTKRIFDEDCEADGSWVIKPLHKPMLGLTSLEIVANFGLANEMHYTVKSFTDTTITLEPKDPAVDLPPTADDILKVNYIFWDKTITPTDLQIDSYAGDAAVSAANLEYLTSIIGANAALEMNPDYAFEYDQRVKKERLYILLAQCYYNLKLFENALIEVQKLDPTFTVDFEADPTALYKLQNKIETLLGGV